MNYLFLMTLLIFSGSCTNYNPFDNNGSDQESGAHYLELDFHQESLNYEYRQHRREMLAIREEIEAGNTEQQGRLEEIQFRLSQIEQDVAWNLDILAARPIIGGGGIPPRCEEGLDYSVLKPCPMPKSALNSLYLASEQWQKSKGIIEVFDAKGRLVGRMEGLSEVADSDGFFLKAEIEFDSDMAYEVRITNLDVREEFRTITYLLQ